MLINSIGLVTIINCQTFFTCTYCCQSRVNPRLVDPILMHMYKPLIIMKPVLCLALDICVHFELLDPMHRGYNIIAPQTSLLRLVSCKRWVIGFTLADWSGGKGHLWDCMLHIMHEWESSQCGLASVLLCLCESAFVFIPSFPPLTFVLLSE